MNPLDITFQNPEFFWLLLLLPVLMLLRGRLGKAAAVEFSSVAVARQIGGAARSRAGGMLFALRMLCLASLIVALARPQLPDNHVEEIDASGIDIVLALDLSGSMASIDMGTRDNPTTRVDIVKKIVGDFIAKRPSDRIGLVAFAGNPYLVSPLTLNHDWLLKNLQRLHLGIIEDGTAIGTALAMATNRLRTEQSKSKVIVLLTDGGNNAGSITPLAAAEAAKAYNIKIDTIGVGAEDPGMLPRVDANGNLLRDQFGRIVFWPGKADGVEVDDLVKMANLTGGKFYRATDAKQLEQIYSDLEHEEKTAAHLRRYATYQELFYWPALLGIGLIGLEQILAHTRLRRLP